MRAKSGRYSRAGGQHVPGRERAIHVALEVISCWHVHLHVPCGGRAVAREGLLSSGEGHTRVEGKEASGQLGEACAGASTWCWPPVLRVRRWGCRVGAVAS